MSYNADITFNRADIGKIPVRCKNFRCRRFFFNIDEIDIQAKDDRFHALVIITHKCPNSKCKRINRIKIQL